MAAAEVAAAVSTGWPVAVSAQGACRYSASLNTHMQQQVPAVPLHPLTAYPAVRRDGARRHSIIHRTLHWRSHQPAPRCRADTTPKCTTTHEQEGTAADGAHIVGPLVVVPVPLLRALGRQPVQAFRQVQRHICSSTSE